MPSSVIFLAFILGSPHSRSPTPTTHCALYSLARLRFDSLGFDICIFCSYIQLTRSRNLIWHLRRSSSTVILFVHLSIFCFSQRSRTYPNPLSPNNFTVTRQQPNYFDSVRFRFTLCYCSLFSPHLPAWHSRLFVHYACVCALVCVRDVRGRASHLWALALPLSWCLFSPSSLVSFLRFTPRTCMLFLAFLSRAFAFLARVV